MIALLYSYLELTNHCRSNDFNASIILISFVINLWLLFAFFVYVFVVFSFLLWFSLFPNDWACPRFFVFSSLWQIVENKTFPFVIKGRRVITRNPVDIIWPYSFSNPRVIRCRAQSCAAFSHSLIMDSKCFGHLVKQMAHKCVLARNLWLAFNIRPPSMTYIPHLQPPSCPISHLTSTSRYGESFPKSLFMIMVLSMTPQVS